MKKFTSAVILTAAVALANQAAQAQVNSGDLVIGFTSASAATDYVVDLGSLSSFSTTSITQLGSLISQNQINTTFGGINGVNVGAIAGNPSQAGPGDFAATTLLRLGGNAVGVQGTESAPATPGGNGVTGAGTDAISLSLGTPSPANAFSFSTQANPLTAGGFANNLATSPLSTVSGSTISEDIFESTRLPVSGRSTPATPFAYLGQLDLDLSGSSPSLEFVPAGFSAVPEPGTYGLLAGTGLLALALRRQFISKNA